MTTRQVLEALVRRWYLVVVVALLSGSVGWKVAQAPPVYQTEADVYFLAPPSKDRERLGLASASTIAVAGLVEREIAGRDAAEVVSPDVTLVDEGIDDGSAVVLPNSGGQWSYSFSRPVLTVSATAASPEVAAARRERLAAEVRRTLQRLQTDDDVPAAVRIRTRQVPDEPTVSVRQGQPTRAGALAALIGGLGGLGSVVLWDRRTRRPSPRVANRPH